LFFRYYMLFLLSQITTSAKILLTPRNTDRNTDQRVPVYGISIPIPAKLPVRKWYTTPLEQIPDSMSWLTIHNSTGDTELTINLRNLLAKIRKSNIIELL
jgi:hypothetical protein